jgi:PAS domain S-box-containing protein
MSANKFKGNLKKTGDPRAEPRINETQSRLAAIVNSSDDAIIGKTLKGIITSWNPGAETIFGYSTEEAIGKPMLMLIPRERSSEEREILARIGRGETVDHFETVRVRKDGRLIDVSATISPIRNESGKIIGASKIARDITERKQAEASLHLSRTLIDESSDGFEVIDPGTGRFLDVNGTTCRRLGYTREEMLAMSVPDIEAVAVDFSSWGKNVEEIRKAGFKIIEGLHKRKDGSTFPVEVSVRYVKLERDYLVASVRDITERKKTVQRLSKREYQVMCLTTSGKSLKEIAGELSISVQTVSTHRARALKKTGLHSTAELIRYVLEKGLAD